MRNDSDLNPLVAIIIMIALYIIGCLITGGPHQ